MDRPESTRAAQFILGLVRSLLNLYFRRVEHTGSETVPKTGGGLLGSWHPNGLIDPGLIVTSFPRQVVFGAREGLFQWPILGRLIRALETVPIYRAQDANGPPEARQADRPKVEMGNFFDLGC